MTSRRVRVRFAPSPTGPLHIGGVRTALFNYLFARKHGGDFLLRIEDTDQTRFVPGAEQYITEAFAWCGLAFDESPQKGGPHAPYRQSERKPLYRKYADQLVASGNAYYAFDTPEELEKVRADWEKENASVRQYNAVTRMQMRNSLSLGDAETKQLLDQGVAYVIRFKMPADEWLTVTDIIRGDVRVNTNELDDKVLFKSDGMPTYHLANVVDDYLMQISHVIRGEEWLPSLPLHVLLYRSFGWIGVMPQFAHLPLILKPEGAGKLSKRDGDKMGFPVFPLQWTDPETGVISSGYRESGYLPNAFINMLALLGWNSGTEQEIFTIEELTAVFDLEKVNKSGARFSPEKTRWFNQQYMQTAPLAVLTETLSKILNEKNITASAQYIQHVCSLVRERVVLLPDIWQQSHFFFVAPASYDEQAVKKNWKEQTAQWLQEVANIIASVEQFDVHTTENTVKEWLTANNIGMGKVLNPLRIALVGAAAGPHLFDIVVALGKQETVKRIQQAVKTIGA